MKAMTSSPHEIPALHGPVRKGSGAKAKLKAVPAPAPAPVADRARAAHAVQGMNSAQLASAQDFIFRLADYDGDTEVISELAGQHPEEMSAALELTSSVLGSAAEWHEAAARKWQESEWSSESLTAGRLATVFWNASAALAPVAAAGVSMYAGLHSAITLVAALAAAVAVLVFLPRPVDVGVPSLHPRDVEQLHTFVAEAVFADLLDEKDALTPGQASALRRGRDHLLFIAATTSAMSMRPFDPATVHLEPIKQAA